MVEINVGYCLLWHYDRSRIISSFSIISSIIGSFFMYSFFTSSFIIPSFIIPVVMGSFPLNGISSIGGASAGFAVAGAATLAPYHYLPHHPCLEVPGLQAVEVDGAGLSELPHELAPLAGLDNHHVRISMLHVREFAHQRRMLL